MIELEVETFFFWKGTDLHRPIWNCQSSLIAHYTLFYLNTLLRVGKIDIDL